ncbi:MAG: hypothetical protein ACK4RK_12805 [Gemmataceae bacterium]
MSSATDPQNLENVPGEKIEERIIAHSGIFYWWPVWFFGYVMAILTYVDAHLVAFVPKGTMIGYEAQGSAQVIETVDGTPQPKSVALDGRNIILPPTKTDLAPPHIHMSQSKTPGVIFAIVILLVILFTNVHMRGVWSVVAIMGVVFFVLLFSLMDIWNVIFDYFTLLAIHINVGGYVFISTVLFILWAVIFFFWDTRTYMIFTVGQVRVCQEIGEGEKVYDTTNLKFEKKQNDIFRHRILGLWGAGDLKFRTGGPNPEEFEMHNVLWVTGKVRRIQRLIKTRDVV